MTHLCFTSIDVAIKSLTISTIGCNPHYLANMQDILSEFTHDPITSAGELSAKVKQLIDIVRRMVEIYTSRVVIRSIHIFDLLPGKTTKVLSLSDKVEITQNLVKALNVIPSAPITLIESQMGRKSECVMYQLMYEFVKRGSQVHLVGPSLKNTIGFGVEEAAHHNYWVEKYKKNYSANKAHAKYNFDKAMMFWNVPKEVYGGIKSANKDDAGDTLLMCLAWVSREWSGWC